MDLRDKIRSIQDFPKPGILFRDVTPILQNPEYFRAAVDMLARALSGVEFDAIAGPESRGFIFGAPLAYVMGKPFIPVRKAGKLPYKTRRASYELEYGEAVVEMHEDAFLPGERIVIADDLLATGGTARAICGMIEDAGGSVAALAFLIELDALKGRQVLGGYDVRTILNF